MKIKMKILLLIPLTIFHLTTAENVIYSLSSEDYYRMPAKVYLDRIQSCREQRGGVYCTAIADVVSDKPSELLDMMKGYSAHDSTHFNYTNVKYGLCITTTCKKFYDGDDSDSALWNTTEACLNDSFSRKHDLKVRVTDLDCYRHGQTFNLEFVDRAILMILGLILALDVVGSLYDFYRDQSTPGNRFLLLFSIFASWKSFTAPTSKNPKQVQLRSLNGLRALCSLIVVGGHIPMPVLNAGNNPESFEKLLNIKGTALILNGHLITATFFTISGFLLAYQTEATAEKHKMNWKTLVKNIINRWLRLSPINFVMMMVAIVWYKFTPIGPLFKEFLLRESNDCRKYWYYNIFYLNNLIDFSMCTLQVWFLGSDFQLHLYGLAIIVLSTSKRVRNWALLALALGGVIWPAYLIYAHDLDGTFLATPTSHNTYYLSSVTFNRIFKPAMPNAPIFVIGMIFGFLVHRMQKNNLTNGNYKKYRVAYWTVIVLYFLNILTGCIFYVDGPRPPLLVRVLYTPIVKPLTAIFVNLIILGAVCKCDDFVRCILEWTGWTKLYKISYCMFLGHMFVIRYLGGTRDSQFDFSLFTLTHEIFGLLCFTIILALLMHLLVELPLAGLTDTYLSFDKPHKSTESEAKVTKQQLTGPEERDELKAD